MILFCLGKDPCVIGLISSISSQEDLTGVYVDRGLINEFFL